MNHRKQVVAFGMVLLTAIVIAVGVLLKDGWLSSGDIAIHIVVDNQTNQQIGPFVISEHQTSAPLHVNKLEPFSVADVYYRKSESFGENAIVMTDSDGKDYAVIPYFENDQKGRVDIRVECVNPDGLSGQKRNLTSWYFSFEWNSWGRSACK